MRRPILILYVSLAAFSTWIIVDCNYEVQIDKVFVLLYKRSYTKAEPSAGKQSQLCPSHYLKPVKQGGGKP